MSVLISLIGRILIIALALSDTPWISSSFSIFATNTDSVNDCRQLHKHTDVWAPIWISTEAIMGGCHITKEGDRYHKAKEGEICGIRTRKGCPTQKGDIVNEPGSRDNTAESSHDFSQPGNILRTPDDLLRTRD